MRRLSAAYRNLCQENSGDPSLPDAAAKAFDELGTPEEQRGLNPERSPEQMQLDQHFPVAKPAEYVIQYERPGQERPMDAAHQQQRKQFDQNARSWLAGAGFTREHGSA